VTGSGSDRTAAIPGLGMPRALPDVRLRAAGLTDLGLVRTNNEDSFALGVLDPAAPDDGAVPADAVAVGRKGVMLVVSDGMGGHSAGEVASRIAVDTLRRWLRAEWGARPERDATEELRNDLRAAVAAANREVLEEGERESGRRGMGATLTAGVVLGTKLVLAHVGDSRCYLLRGGVLKTLTADQTLAEELVRRGMVERGSEEYLARRSVLTRVVGQPGRLEADSETADLCRGDRLLLCSDGLHGPVGDETIADILGTCASPEEACRELVAEAHRAGAPDNCTCVVAFAEGPGLPDPDAVEGGGGTSSIALDPGLADGAADATLGIEVARRDATAEFAPGDLGSIDRSDVAAAPAEETHVAALEPPLADTDHGAHGPDAGHGHGHASGHGHAAVATAASHHDDAHGHHAPAATPAVPSLLGFWLVVLAAGGAAFVLFQALRR
jgi:serine/threonine protein phosphatase PrpC